MSTDLPSHLLQHLHGDTIVFPDIIPPVCPASVPGRTGMQNCVINYNTIHLINFNDERLTKAMRRRSRRQQRRCRRLLTRL